MNLQTRYWVTTTLLMCGLFAGPASAQTAGQKVNPLMSQDLAGLAGKEGVMLTVEYEPGGSSAPHRHNAHVFVYVLEGSIVMQANGGNPVTLTTGQTFYESPADIHAVSKNASDSQRAKFVVFVLKDKGSAIVLPAN